MSEIKNEIKENADGSFTITDAHSTADIVRWLLTQDSKETILYLLKEALAQPEQEPMALPCCAYTDASAIKWNPYNQVVQCHNCGQIYTTPPQRTWVGLTRAERFEIEKAMSKYYDYQHECKTVCLPEFAAAIEAKLKEKNT
jgi:hypothetical protein